MGIDHGIAGDLSDIQQMPYRYGDQGGGSNIQQMPYKRRNSFTYGVKTLTESRLEIKGIKALKKGKDRRGVMNDSTYEALQMLQGY